MAVSYKDAGQKRLAIGCLKRKKLIEAEIDSIFEQRLRIDTQEHTLTSLKFSAITFDVERRATEAIKAKVKKMGGADKLEEHRADAEEALEDAYDMLGIAAQPLNNPALGDLDDDALLAELEQMSEHAADKEADERALRELSEVRDVSVNGASSSSDAGYLQLPPVPPTEPRKQSQQRCEEAETAELEQLTASMAVEQPMPMLGLAPPMVAVHA